MARWSGAALMVLGMAAGLASLGCSPEDPPRPRPETGFWDEGRAETASVIAHALSLEGTPTPIAEGDTLRLDYGPQGGSHVEIDVQAEGIDATTTRLGARLERPDGTVVAEAFVYDFYGEGPGYEQRVFVQAFDVLSGPLVLRVRVRDGSGAQGTTEVGVEVR